MIKNILIIIASILGALAPLISHASLLNESNAVENVGIFLRELQICHQREWRNLTINLEYQADSSNTLQVKENVKTFLENYSNPDDFWEVMNTNLVWTLVESFPEITNIKSTLSLSPDKTLQFPRESIVKYNKGSETLDESFNFTKLNYYICQETFSFLNMHVSWNMKDSPNPSSDYPDYKWVDEAMELFFKEHPVSYSEWKTLKPKLQSYLLERFPSVESIDVEVRIAE